MRFPPAAAIVGGMALLEIMRTDTRWRTAGRRAIERAKAAGVPAIYRGDGGELVREMPDGRRQSVRIDAGERVVIGELPIHRTGS